MDYREEKGLLLYSSCTAPGAQSFHAGSNFPIDSPPKQNVLPNGTGCVLVTVSTAVSFPHF